MSNGQFNNRGTISSSVFLSGTFTNNGVMHGTVNQSGIFTNNGFIYNYVRVGGTFENNSSIIIDHDDGITMGLEVFGTFTNDQVVDIKKLSNPGAPCIGIDIRDGSNFVNNAFIDIDSVTGVGFKSEADLTTNSAFANIRINDILPYGMSFAQGMVLTDAAGENDGTNFLNDGFIWIENIDGVGLLFNDNNPTNRVTLTNNKLVEIKEASGGGIDMVEFQAPFFPIRGHFINNLDADLRVIMNGTGGQKGIKCMMTNYGAIDVTGQYATGIEGYLENYGEVNTDGGARGMDVEYFNNASSGHITSGNDLYTDSINNYYGPSINEGLIQINTGDLWLQQHVTNKPCGSILVSGSLVTFNSKKLFNEGILTFNGPSDLSDCLYNTGVIYDAFGSLISDADFHNDGVHIKQVGGTHSCGDMINNISSGSNSESIPSPSITTDKAGLVSAGTYDLPNHKVTLAGNTGGLDTLYVHFMMATGCDRTIPIVFNNEITCAQCGDNLWVGSISNDWHTAGNWSESVIPTDCQTVKINNNNVVVGSGMMGTCRLLEVAVGATLDVLGQLEVVGN